MYLGSCYNHILHNGVKHGHKLLTIDIEKNLLSIYSHFSRSAKRIAELKSYYEFYEEDYLVIKFGFEKITSLQHKLFHCSRLGNSQTH